MEKFITYKYDGIFYSKKELEQMGFIFVSSTADLENIRDIKLEDCNLTDYIITEKDSMMENTHNIQEWIDFSYKHIDERFFADYGQFGIFLSTQKFYGIKHNDNVWLFEYEQDFNTAINDLDEIIMNKMQALSLDNYNNEKYIRQSKESEMRNKILNINPNDNMIFKLKWLEIPLLVAKLGEKAIASLDPILRQELFQVYYDGLQENKDNGFTTTELVIYNKPHLYNYLLEKGIIEKHEIIKESVLTKKRK